MHVAPESLVGEYCIRRYKIAVVGLHFRNPILTGSTYSGFTRPGHKRHMPHTDSHNSLRTLIKLNTSMEAVAAIKLWLLACLKVTDHRTISPCPPPPINQCPRCFHSLATLLK